MRVADFTFELPDSLIARHPLAERRNSRLLTLDGVSGALAHRQFTDLLEHLRPGDLMVFNNTRVIPARLFGQKASGGKLEILVERVLDSHRVLAHVRSSKSPKPGSKILIDGGGEAEMLARHDALFELEFAEEVLPLLDRVGHMPLPPYIDRPDEGSDRERYQTVYAERLGAVAAPTAGLHFTDEILRRLDDAGVERAFVTLHVGLGTFKPVTADTLEGHAMHAETYSIPPETAGALNRAKVARQRIIAVGTTSARVLESQPADETFVEKSEETSIFIYPPYRWKYVSAMITNFHLPRSTLIAMIAAMVGLEEQRRIYRSAIEERYRFFSYGDAMFIE